MRRTGRGFWWAGLLAGLSGGARAAETGPFSLQRAPAASAKDYVELRGVGAGEFQPAFWRSGKLHFLPD